MRRVESLMLRTGRKRPHEGRSTTSVGDPTMRRKKSLKPILSPSTLPSLSKVCTHVIICSHSNTRNAHAHLVAVSDYSTGVGTFTISLSFLPYFSAVCASTSSITLEDIPESQHGSFLEKSALLHCLFEGDTGRTSPNSVVSFHIRKHGGDLFSAAVRQHGFPYKWVQRMCGVDLNPEGPDSTALQPLVEVSAKSLEAVVGALKGRFICQVHLTRQIVAMGEFSEMCLCRCACGCV